MRSKGYYTNLIQSMVVTDKTVWDQAADLLRNKARYEVSSRVPWWVLATIHCMEADGNLTRQAFNGEAWTKRTSLVPKGIGPWPSLEASLIDLANQLPPIISFEDALSYFEKHNGAGYEMRGKHSAYLWAGTNHGSSTGYFRKDGQYDPAACKSDAGAAALMYALLFEEKLTDMWPGMVKVLQESLNLYVGAKLIPDGHLGPLTAKVLLSTIPKAVLEKLRKEKAI